VIYLSRILRKVIYLPHEILIIILMKTTEQKTSRMKKLYWTQGFLGFLGFLGCLYFKEHDPKYLIYFSFFSFFVYFFTGRLAMEMQDERMKVNHKKALLLALKIPLVTILVVGLFPTFATLTETTAIIICMIGFVLTAFTYGISFYYYDKN
jgi:peptidoglycan/LPS O-acetylase OafA/YrhL